MQSSKEIAKIISKSSFDEALRAWQTLKPQEKPFCFGKTRRQICNGNAGYRHLSELTNMFYTDGKRCCNYVESLSEKLTRRFYSSRSFGIAYCKLEETRKRFSWKYLMASLTTSVPKSKRVSPIMTIIKRCTLPGRTHVPNKISWYRTMPPHMGLLKFINNYTQLILSAASLLVRRRWRHYLPVLRGK